MLQGQQTATQAISQAKNSLQQQGADLERIAQSVGYGLEKVIKGVAGFFGLVLTFEGFKNLEVDAAQAGTTMGRFAESIGRTVEETQAYRQAFTAFTGGETGILQTIRRMKLDLEAVPKIYTPWMSAVGMLTGESPIGKEPEQILQEVADAVARRRMSAAQAIMRLGQSLPLTEEDILLLSKPGELQKALERQRKNVGTPTTPQVRAMEQLQADVTDIQTVNSLLELQALTLMEPFLHELLTMTVSIFHWMRGIAKMLGFPSLTSPAAATISPSVGAAVGVGSRDRVGFGGVTTYYKPPSSQASVLSTGVGHRTGFNPKSGRFETTTVTPGGTTAPGAVSAVDGGPPSAFIMHHTGGGGNVAGVQQTLRERGLGVEYVMDREGNITQIGGPGSSHMMTGWGGGAGLSNRNTVGMEVIAKDDKDVTPAQIAAAQKFIAEKYPNTPVFGHGEVNPGHKEADEGMSIVNAIRRQRQGAQGAAVRGSTFSDVQTSSGASAATSEGIAIPAGGKMGDLYEITTPDGRKFVAPLIDRGPASWTGRGIDVSGPLAKKMYPKDFPTDSIFHVRPYVSPVPIGAAAAAQSFDANRPKVENNETSTHVNQIIVHTNATDATGIAADVKDAIGKQLEAPVGAAPP